MSQLSEEHLPSSVICFNITGDEINMEMIEMLLTEKVEVKWHYLNKEHFEAILNKDKTGKYKFTKYKDTFTVDVMDLQPRSTSEIQIQCDYCNKTEDRLYGNWKTHYDASPIKKDACKKCIGIKRKEANLVLHGVENVMHLKEAKEKMENTNLQKYGVKYSGGSEIVQEKLKQHNLEQYGTEHYFKTSEFKSKYINSMQEKYGVDNSFQSEEVKEKSRKTMLAKYGVEYNMQHPRFREQAVKTMYSNGTTPTSFQQLHLHEIYQGELNYPFQRYNLDIAIVEDKIVIEYDGSGHDLKVKLGGISEEDFKRREIIRSGYLKKDGWKLITIKSTKDRLPDKTTLLDMFSYSKSLFNKGRSWITFDMDNSTVEYRNFKDTYNFGEVKHIRRVN